MAHKVSFKLAVLGLAFLAWPIHGYSHSLQAGESTFLDSLRPDFSLLGGFTLSNLTLLPENVASSYGTSHSMGIGWGYAFLVGADIKPTLGAELGLFFTRKKLGLSGQRSSGNLGINEVNLPLMARWTPFTPLSLHAGFFLGVGSASSISIDGGSTGPVDSSVDRGILLGVTVNRPIYSDVYFLLGGFYELGLKDVSANFSNAKTRSLDMFIGVKYTFP